MGCYGLVLYSVSMSICSAAIERYDLFNKLGMKFMYVCVYTLIAISSFVMFLYPSKWVILSLTLVIGSGFAVLYTLPFQILSRYFRSKIYLRKVLTTSVNLVDIHFSHRLVQRGAMGSTALFLSHRPTSASL